MIPLTCPLDTWQSFVLPVPQDALAVLQDGGDNSPQKIRIGVRARNGAEVQAYFDTFEIIHDPGLQGSALLELQEGILQRYDSLTQLVGTEVSYHNPHLTVFCDGLPQLLDYGTVDEETYAETAVTRAHDGGCLVAYAHPFGTLENLVSDEEQDERVRTMAAQLLTNSAHGADLSAAGAVMGGEGVVSNDTTDLTIHLTPDHGGEVKLVQGVIQPGPGVEYVRYQEVVDPAMPVVLDTTRPSFVRVELWQNETPVAFSNPLRLVRTN